MFISTLTDEVAPHYTFITAVIVKFTELDVPSASPVN